MNSLSSVAAHALVLPEDFAITLRDPDAARRRKARKLRQEAQLAYLDMVPAGIDYLGKVLAGAIPGDPERTKIALRLLDKVLPNLASVQIDGALGVESRGSSVDSFVEALRQASQEASRREAELREVRTLEHQPDDAGEGL